MREPARPLTLVMMGPHASGKTTLGRLLAVRLGLPFHEELGEVLARDPRWRPPGRTAAHAQPRFDDALFQAELVRDAAAGPRVVESWHPGNLGYATSRSPEVVARHLPRVRQAVGACRAWAVVLGASETTLRRRQHEPGDPAFFLGVAGEARAWLSRLGVPELAVVNTDDTPPDALADAVIRAWAAISPPR